MQPYAPTTAGKLFDPLNVRRLPARLDVDQVATILSLHHYEIPILIRAKLLTPLGKPAQNGRKLFATCEIQQLAANKDWLDAATRVVQKHVHNANLKDSGASVPVQAS